MNRDLANCRNLVDDVFLLRVEDRNLHVGEFRKVLRKWVIHQQLPLLIKLQGADRDLACVGLAMRAKTQPEIVQRLLEAHSAKAIVALCWRAGLAMSTALTVQTVLGRIPREAALSPRPDGTYPISVEAMLWQLDFFGIAPPEAA